MPASGGSDGRIELGTGKLLLRSTSEGLVDQPIDRLRAQLVVHGKSAFESCQYFLRHAAEVCFALLFKPGMEIIRDVLERDAGHTLPP